MHPSLDDLLALRDGEGPAEAARHVERCGRCSDELEELRSAASALRSLPSLGMDRDLWPAIRSQVFRQRRRNFLLRLGAAAATVVAAVATAVLVRSPALPTGPETAQAGAEVAIEELTAASRGLEAVLHNPALRRQVLSPRRAAVIVDLEDRIATLDMVMADQTMDWGVGENVAMWSRRVELLDALVTARTGALGEEGVGYAVFRYEGSQP